MRGVHRATPSPRATSVLVFFAIAGMRLSARSATIAVAAAYSASRRICVKSRRVLARRKVTPSTSARQWGVIRTGVLSLAVVRGIVLSPPLLNPCPPVRAARQHGRTMAPVGLFVARRPQCCRRRSAKTGGGHRRCPLQLWERRFADQYLTISVTT